MIRQLILIILTFTSTPALAQGPAPTPEQVEKSAPQPANDAVPPPPLQVTRRRI